MNNKCTFWTHVPVGPDLLDQKTNQIKDTQSEHISVDLYGLVYLKKDKWSLTINMILVSQHTPLPWKV